MHDWRLEDQDPYVRYVAPYKGFLYQRMALDKNSCAAKAVISTMKQATAMPILSPSSARFRSGTIRQQYGKHLASYGSSASPI